MTELSKDEEYGIVSKHLGTLTALRKFAQTKDFEWLEEVKGKLEALITESRKEYELKKLAAEELEQKRKQALEYIRSLGLDPDYLTEPVTVGGIKSQRKNAKSGVRKAKYRFTDELGNAKEWSGNGKSPSALQTLLDAGHSLDEYLINKVQP